MDDFKIWVDSLTTFWRLAYSVLSFAPCMAALANWWYYFDQTHNNSNAYKEDVIGRKVSSILALLFGFAWLVCLAILWK